MSERDVLVIVEVELRVTLGEPFDNDAVRQAVQYELGHAGAVVLEVLWAEGAQE